MVGTGTDEDVRGGGSTAVGASRCGRDSISVELEEEYFDVAKDRLEDEKGTLTNYESLSMRISR